MKKKYSNAIWIVKKHEDLQCSACGTYYENNGKVDYLCHMNYCGCCGARMMDENGFLRMATEKQLKKIFKEAK